MYQATHGGAFTSIKITPQATSDAWSASPKAILTQDSLTVYLLGMDSTDGKIYEYHASWAANEATWQASEIELSSTKNMPLGASNSVWPKTAGISWCQPAAGQDMHIMYYEDGSPYSMQIWTQDVTWTPDLTTAWPTITTAGLPDGTVNVLYTKSLSKSGGTAPFEWSLITAPAWLEIGLTTGILSGTSTSTGVFTVTVKLIDATGRSDEKVFSLTIKPVVEEGEPLPEDALSLSGSMDSFLGAMWWLFIFMATFIAVIDTVMNFRKSHRGGPL